MGSGKSSIGKQLASILGFKYFDLDSYIELKEAKTVSELFLTKGEIYFRKVERLYLEEVLLENKNFVLSTGGGTPCYGNTMQYITTFEGSTTVYLQTSLEVLTQRLMQEKDKRPIISHIETQEVLNDFIRKHLFERSFYYNQASVKIKTDGKKVSNIVDSIIETLF